MNAKQTGIEIAETIIFEYEAGEKIPDDRLEKDSYLAVADLKANIKEEAIKHLKEKGYKVEEWT